MVTTTGESTGRTPAQRRPYARVGGISLLVTAGVVLVLMSLVAMGLVAFMDWDVSVLWQSVPFALLPASLATLGMVSLRDAEGSERPRGPVVLALAWPAAWLVLNVAMAAGASL